MSGAPGGNRLFRILLCLTVISALFISCKPAASASSFDKKIARIDALAAAGKKESALRQLASLRKGAGSASQWLSIARRERELGRYASSEATLKAALKAIPANEALSAVMADTLIELGNFERASAYSKTLVDSGYAPIAAYVEIKRSLLSGSAYPAPEWYAYAYEAVGNTDFLANAGILYAGAGNYAASCALFPEPSEQAVLSVDQGAASTDQGSASAVLEPLPSNSYLHALLCYDGGFYSRIDTIFPKYDDPRLTDAMLALLSDTAWRTGDIDRARLLWGELTARYADFSPIPHYNLAVTSQSLVDEYAELRRCLSLFPSWYPAVSRYVRSAEPARDAVTAESDGGESVFASDSVEDTLEKAGFMSLDMEEARKKRRISRDEARDVLSRALSPESSGRDVRLKIEELRFELAANRDAIRSTSDLWKLLESYDDNPVLYQYATWYFTVTGNFDVAFSLNKENPGGPDPFYDGLEAELAGKWKEAEESYAKVASSATDSWAALANIARICAVRQDFERAEEMISLAATLAPDDRVRSRLQAVSAEYLLELNYPDRAITVLAYALELDPSNYRAAARLRELEAEN